MPLLRDESVAEFTARAVVTGILLGVIFGVANAYLGLRVGLTVSASIPAAVMTVALFRRFRRNATILEAKAAGKSMPVLLSGLPGTRLSTLMLLAVDGLLIRAGKGKTA